MRDLAKLDETTMYAIGFDRVTVTAFRKILEATQVILPEVAAQGDTTATAVSGLGIAVVSAQDMLAILAADNADLPTSDNAMQRRIADIESELQEARTESRALRRALEELVMQTTTPDALAAVAKAVEALRDELALMQEAQSARAAAGGSAAQAFATGPLSVNGAGGAPIPLRVTANSGANGMQLIGRSDHLGFIEFFKNDGTTLEGSIYGGTGKLVLTGPAGTDALTVSAAGVAVAGAFSVNGAAPQAAYALGAASTDLATVITLANNLRTMAINNGMGS